MRRFFARSFSHGICHLALLALMMLTFAPGGVAFWQCEGRVCGVSFLACCCDQPAADHDPQCGPSRTEKAAHFESQAHLRETVCRADCHCTMVVEKLRQTASRPNVFTPPLLLVAVLPAPVAVIVPPQNGMVRPAESRGPPLQSSLASPSLRAPPCA